MRFDGAIQSWNDDRGFGFIEPSAGGQQVFVHIKAFRGLQDRRPTPGQLVTFEVEVGPQGKKRAFNVEPAPVVRRRAAEPLRSHGPSQRRRNGSAQWGTASLFAIPAFLMVLAAGYAVGHPPRWLLWLYPAVSAVTFLVYGADKSAAARRAWRVSEKTLHLLALAGGWPGALLAQQVFRHKSSKAEFRAVFWATVVVNVAAFAWLASPYGQALGQQLGLGR